MAKREAPPVVRLAEEAFPELNATLYQSNPAEYFHTRLGSLFAYLSRASDQSAEPIKYSLGAMQAEWFEANPDHETKLRFAAMEASILLHHAGETLLRLYLAHAEEPRCPWLSVAKLRNFSDFKRTIATAFKPPVASAVRERIALVFLGGRSPDEAEVDVSQAAWEEAVAAYTELLSVVADKLLSESDLYNAAKHGLVGVPQDSGTLSFGNGDQEIAVGGGPAVLYLGQMSAREAPNLLPDERWTVTSAYVRADSTLMIVDLIARAISSLWSAARRKYCGEAGQVYLFKCDTIRAAAFGATIAAGHLASGIKYQIPAKKMDEIQPTTSEVMVIRLGQEILDAYDRVNGVPQTLEITTVEPRTRDFQPSPQSGRSLFSFSPPGSSIV